MVVDGARLKDVAGGVVVVVALEVLFSKDANKDVDVVAVGIGNVSPA